MLNNPINYLLNLQVAYTTENTICNYIAYILIKYLHFCFSCITVCIDLSHIRSGNKCSIFNWLILRLILTNKKKMRVHCTHIYFYRHKNIICSKCLFGILLANSLIYTHMYKQNKLNNKKLFDKLNK